jgi:Ni/Fe-hydrogenase subunit HybB-like protein
MFAYLFLKALVFIHGQHGALVLSTMGYWYLLEVVGFVLVPCVLFTKAVRSRSLSLVRTAAILTLVGVVLNRLNISIIAFKWDALVRYVPTWMEIEVTVAIILAEIWAFRWIVHRMPVLREPPAWAAETGTTPVERYEPIRLAKEA